MVGGGANRKRTANSLRLLVEQTGIPVVSTQMGLGVLPSDHELFIGCAALSANDYVHVAIELSDLIISVGHDVVEKPPFFMVNGVPRVIHVNFEDAKVDPVYQPQLSVIGDIGNALWQIKEALGKPKHYEHSTMLEIRKALRCR